MNLNLLNKMKTRIYDEVLFRQNEELINNKDIMNNRFLFAPLLSLSLSLTGTESLFNTTNFKANEK